MLFKHKHLLEQLRKNGRKGTGEILSITTVGGGSSARQPFRPDSDITTTWTDAKLKLRVVPDDRLEPPFEANVLTRLHSIKNQGDHVPVWYDPEDRGKVVVDYEADAQRIMQGLADLTQSLADADRLKHRHDNQLGRVWTPVSGELLPLDVHAYRGTGKVEASGPVSAVAQQSAQTAYTAVRAQGRTLLPQLTLDDAWFNQRDLRVELAYGGLPKGSNPDHKQWADTAAAIVAALVSFINGHIVRTEVAVTGGLAPDGALLPVTGLKDKVRWAKRGYAQYLVMPTANRTAAEQLSQKDRQDLEFIYAADLNELLRHSLTRRPVSGFTGPA